MKFTESKIHGVLILENEVFEDNRGAFGRLFNADIFGVNETKNIKQVNHSFTLKKETFRGFHYQKPPFAETKIIKCIKGSVYDIYIDVRENSPTFLKYEIIELNETDKKTLLLPEGVAHGFQSITDNVEMLYLHTQFYNPEYEGAINFAEPLINLNLPLDIKVISEKDKNIKFLPENFKGILI
jgi:dTDP-4-dehydrorhamnose 3,5-epimerase